jgi:hypothetical protein
LRIKVVALVCPDWFRFKGVRRKDMLAYSTTNTREDGPIRTNPGRDAAHFASGLHFEQLEGGDPTALLKASQKQNGPRQHRNLDTQQALGQREVWI